MFADGGGRTFTSAQIILHHVACGVSKRLGVVVDDELH